MTAWATRSAKLCGAILLAVPCGLCALALLAVYAFSAAHLAAGKAVSWLAVRLHLCGLACAGIAQDWLRDAAKPTKPVKSDKREF